MTVATALCLTSVVLGAALAYGRLEHYFAVETHFRLLRVVVFAAAALSLAVKHIGHSLVVAAIMGAQLDFCFVTAVLRFRIISDVAT